MRRFLSILLVVLLLLSILAVPASAMSAGDGSVDISAMISDSGLMMDTLF